MPPKIPSFKRRLRDEDERSPGRHKKQGKHKEPTYDTYDEAFDGGVEMEEKGERYRDGEKARRFYEKAAELYQKAMQFEETYDATYNLARVQFVLASNFLLPPSSLDIYGSAIALFRRAWTLDTPSVSLSLHIDACFNLAQACLALGEATEESQGEWAAEGVKELRDAARIFFEQTLVKQEEFLAAAAAERSEGGGQEEGEAMDVSQGEEGAETIDAEARTEDVAMDEDEGKSAGEEGKKDDDDDDDNEEEGMAGASDSPVKAVFETHEPTPSALVDTALALLDVHLSMWEASSQPPTEDEQTMVHSILALAATHVTPGRQAELDLAEINVLLTQDRIVWRLFRSEARPGPGVVERSLEGAANALTSLYNSLDTQRPDEDGAVRAEVLTMLAEAHMGAAARIAFVSRLEASEQAAATTGGPSPAGQAAWAHCASAVETLNKIIALPNAGLSTLLKPDTNLSLSKASLARARLADISSAAASNTSQLFDNAAAYAGRAADALGWKFARIDAAAPAIPTPSAAAVTVVPPDLPEPAGWDAEVLARNVVLHQLRVGFYANKLVSAPVQWTSAGADVVIGFQRIAERADALLARVRAIPAGPRAMSGRDVVRWVEDIEDEEGAIPDDEKVWWASLFPQTQAQSEGQGVSAGSILEDGVGSA